MDIAYSNNVAGALTTTAAVRHRPGSDVLVLQGGNAGTLTTIGPLGVDIVSMAASIFRLTAGPPTHLLPAGSSQSSLYSIDLHRRRDAGGHHRRGLFISSMTVSPPEPATTALATAITAIPLLRRRQG